MLGSSEQICSTALTSGSSCTIDRHFSKLGPPVRTASSQTMSPGSILCADVTEPGPSSRRVDTPKAHSFFWGCKVLAGSLDLTSKEWAITALVSQGSTDAEIAASIHAPEPAVKDCVRSILEKTGCWNRTEIALWYMKLGVEPERRFSDRRVANPEIDDERRKGSRRHPPERSGRAKEQHDVNLDE
jgi:DNA-binding CsgD family transcriptional regulator